MSPALAMRFEVFGDGNGEPGMALDALLCVDIARARYTSLGKGQAMSQATDGWQFLQLFAFAKEVKQQHLGIGQKGGQ